MESARAATADDLDQLAALAGLAVEERRSERGGAEWEARNLPAEWSVQGLAAINASDSAIVVAGLLEESLVGVARAQVETLRTGRRVAFIGELFVLPDAREVGVGEAMMDLLLKWSTDQRCDAVEAMVLPGNRQAKNMFERYGLVARAIIVQRRLNE